MKKLLLSTATFLLAGGLAVAQSDPNAQQPSTQQDPSAQSSQTNVGGNTDQNEQLFRGCVSGSQDNYMLTAEDGKSYKLHSDKDINEHLNKQVEIRGTVKPEGDNAAASTGSGQQQLDVADIKTVADSCSGSAGSAGMASDSSQASSTQAAPASSGSQTTASPDSSMSQAQPSGSQPGSTTSTESSQTTTTTTTSTEIAPSSAEQQPAAPAAGTESPEAQQVQPDSDPAAAQAQPETDVNQTRESQGAAAADQATEQSGDRNAAAADQSADAAADESALPQTASPLPLLALLGLGSVAGGLITRRRK